MATTVADKASLEKASDHITKLLQKDAKVAERDLHDRLLKQARMQENLLYDEASKDAAEVHKRPALAEAPGGFTQMPAALKQAAATLEYYHTFSGLFPQIHRAWMTIDHILFLWDYTDPRGSFYQYDGLDQTIIHASLVRPKPNVFEEDATPQWLLLLSTPVEVVVLGLYTSASGTSVGPIPGGVADGPAAAGGEIDIFETGFSVATDGANLLQIVGTPAGRVFMAGADGFLYELSYGTTRGWLDTYRTCSKRNRSRKREVAMHFVTSAVCKRKQPRAQRSHTDASCREHNRTAQHSQHRSACPRRHHTSHGSLSPSPLSLTWQTTRPTPSSTCRTIRSDPSSIPSPATRRYKCTTWARVVTASTSSQR